MTGATRRVRKLALLITFPLITVASSSCDRNRAAHNDAVVADDSGAAVAVARAQDAARRFLAAYVDPNGRVVRRDQGGDTPGEAQSYGLLLAQVAADGEAFGRIWAWTQASMLQPDGLLAHHVRADGSVDDTNSATDADLVTAWALLRATGPEVAAYHAAGARLAAAVLTNETVTLPGSGMVLAAGQWATGTPVSLNASYWILPAMKGLGRLTGDARWPSLAANAVHLIDTLTRSGLDLPPDWARADGSVVSATPAPNRQAPDVRYSLDAQRLPVWLATSGDPVAGTLASAWWPVLSRADRREAMALDSGGVPLDQRHHPLALVAAAATARAANRPADRDKLLQRAVELDAAQPTYYGAAWVALGLALLTTDALTDGAS
jgi:endoglucanase